MRVRSDEKVNAILDARLHREARYAVKSTDHLGPERIYRDLVNSERKQEEQSQKSRADQLVGRGVKQVTTTHREIWTKRIRKLLVQSKFLDVIDLQEADLTWKSIRF